MRVLAHAHCAMPVELVSLGASGGPLRAGTCTGSEESAADCQACDGSWAYITAPPMATEGGDTILISGRNFGSLNKDRNVTATYGPETGTRYRTTDCHVADDADNTAVVCTTVPGAGGALRWIVTVT